MAGKLNRFQTITFSHWAHTSKLNNLASVFQLQPQKATDMMV